MNEKITGIGFNFGKGENGFYTKKSGKALILDNLKAILLTSPGERVHLPTFGVGLRRFIFEPNDAVLEDILSKLIQEQIAMWEPGVDVLDIAFKKDENMLTVTIQVQLNELSGDIATLTVSA